MKSLRHWVRSLHWTRCQYLPFRVLQCLFSYKVNMSSMELNMFIVLMISSWLQWTIQFTPLVLEHAFSLICSGNGIIQHLFAFSCSHSQSLQCSFSPPPGTHNCWVGRGSMEWEIYLTRLHLTSSGNWTKTSSSWVKCPIHMHQTFLMCVMPQYSRLTSLKPIFKPRLAH